MDYQKEIQRRDRRIENYKKEIMALKEEIVALRQLLDCAAANLVLAVKERGGSLKLSKTDVSEALGKFHLHAKKDAEGNYELELAQE